MHPLLSAALLLAVPPLALAGCASRQLDETGGLKITRSTCPAVAIPAYTGDLSLFSPEQSRDARALDVVASIANLRTDCDETGAVVRANVRFDVEARRASPYGPRDVVLPYFVTVVRNGSTVMSKRESRVLVHFEPGRLLATAQGLGGASVNKSLATLPASVSAKLNRKRRATDADASVDPMSDPRIRTAVNQASFELLIGFQLNDAQLAYNATR